MKMVLLAASALLFVFAVRAECLNVMYDESGDIQPPAVRTVISNACSAIVAVDLAKAKAEILTNVSQIAIETMKKANDLLTRFTDFAVIDTYAVGLEDSHGSTSNSPNAEIAVVGDVLVQDSGANKLVTITWQYVQGQFEDPQMLGSTTLATNDFQTVWRGEPEQLAWGETVAYRATATIPKATYGDRAFFKISARVKGPVDDGKTFDTYSDGTDYWIDLVPTNRYRIRIISQKITTILKVEQ